MLARQEDVVQVEARAETRNATEEADPPPHWQPHMPPRVAMDASSSPALDQGQDGQALVASNTVALARVGREEGLSETDTMSSVQSSHTGPGGQERLPRKKEELPVNAEVEARAGSMAQERLPRKKRNEVLEVEGRPLHVHEERLPRKKENDETTIAKLG